jgi:hypothetical protein
VCAPRSRPRQAAQTIRADVATGEQRQREDERGREEHEARAQVDDPSGDQPGDAKGAHDEQQAQISAGHTGTAYAEGLDA